MSLFKAIKRLLFGKKKHKKHSKHKEHHRPPPPAAEQLAEQQCAKQERAREQEAAAQRAAKERAARRREEDRRLLAEENAKRELAAATDKEAAEQKFASVAAYLQWQDDISRGGPQRATGTPRPKGPPYPHLSRKQVAALSKQWKRGGSKKRRPFSGGGFETNRRRH